MKKAVQIEDTKALRTRTQAGNLAEKVTSHFVAAEIKHLPSGDTEVARLWILQAAS